MISNATGVVRLLAAKRSLIEAARIGLGERPPSWHEFMMAKRAYHGSCHCGKVRFEADLDLAEGTGKCNCSYCWKVRAWNIGIKPDAFRLLSGRENAGEYGFREGSNNHHVFCKSCGVRVYTYGHVEQIGGDYVSVALSTLDDLSPAELVAAPVRYLNGRDDDWFHVPAETRHL